MLVLCKELSPGNRPWSPPGGVWGVHWYLWRCSGHASGTAHSPSVLQGLGKLVGKLFQGGLGTCQSRGEICPCVTFVTNILPPEEADLVKGESAAADRESSRHPSEAESGSWVPPLKLSHFLPH